MFRFALRERRTKEGVHQTKHVMRALEKPKAWSGSRGDIIGSM